DLYYRDPANRGSASLRPEKAWTSEAGADWYHSQRLRASLTVFHRREQDGIDYVRSSPSDVWTATNFQNLQFTGVEASLAISPARNAGQFELGYTGLRGSQALALALQSKYVFNYPVNTGIISWQSNWASPVQIRTRIGVTERYTRSPYAVWDLYAAATRSRIRPFVQFTNLTQSTHQEIPGVATQGRAVLGGLEWIVFRKR
ncbi:MAG: TonB-dependent receptor, partial [Bryobacteraceae bacterium]|nr:TonB-dependent receptor [Bryobacteraceae bacterium]